jgi:YbgC/YbaW family acyl-CoA thioester hydrolase
MVPRLEHPSNDNSEEIRTMAFETTFTVEWGDCDEAGIVFYPNYFYWIDCTFHRWLRSKGVSQRDLEARFGAATPLMDAGCNFRASVSYDDELVVTAHVAEWMEKRFRIAYAMSVGGRHVGAGHELRAWAARGPDGRLKTMPVDPEFRRLLSD